MSYNLNSPGWVPEAELKIIEMLAQTIPRGGNMVEIGAFCGRSSWCWARSADPAVTVHCLDIWNTAEHPSCLLRRSQLLVLEVEARRSLLRP